jgi:alcohol dehydrogenase (NADP+)
MPEYLMVTQKMLSLRDQTQMPAFGLGTWKSKPGEVYDAVRAALELGYRHLDCAAIYGNEDEVGRAISDAIAAGHVSRQDLWVTSKLWNDSHRPEHVEPALRQTLSDLRVEYLDLYLIHWPIAFAHGVEFPQSRDEYLTLEEVPLEATWEAMQQVEQAGLTRQIGVSNMGPERIAALSQAGRAPAVNQVECHPHLQQRELLAFCDERDIVLTAYSPLGSTDRVHRKEDEPPLLEHPTICQIASGLDATAAQVLIAWALARDTSVIPKSVNRGRIAENLASLELELADEHMDAIAELDKGYRYLDGEFFAGEGSPYEASEIWV